MALEKEDINKLLDNINWLKVDLDYLKERIRSGDEYGIREKAKSFIREFENRIERNI